MYRMKFVVAAAIAALSVSILAQAPAGVTVFEGARVIVGDGRAPIENATFVVTGNRFTQVGRAADVRVPAGATRVNLAGKTVMPAIIDTHTHLEPDARDAHRRPEAARVLRRQRGAEPRAGHDRRRRSRSATRRAQGRFPARRASSPPAAASRAGARTHDGAVLGDDGRRSAQGGARKKPPRKSTSSRSGSTTGWAR